MQGVNGVAAHPVPSYRLVRLFARDVRAFPCAFSPGGICGERFTSKRKKFYRRSRSDGYASNPREEAKADGAHPRNSGRKKRVAARQVGGMSFPLIIILDGRENVGASRSAKRTTACDASSSDARPTRTQLRPHVADRRDALIIARMRRLCGGGMCGSFTGEEGARPSLLLWAAL